MSKPIEQPPVPTDPTVPEVKSEASAELARAQQEVSSFRERVRADETALRDAEKRLEDLEKAGRAAAFSPNATMVRDYAHPFSMNGPVDYIARKGDRVHATRGQYEFDDATITMKDGSCHAVAPELVAFDAVAKMGQSQLAHAAKAHTPESFVHGARAISKTDCERWISGTKHLAGQPGMEIYGALTICREDRRKVTCPECLAV